MNILEPHQRENRNAITPKDYCLKPGIAYIFWTFDDGATLYQYYCNDHLEKHVRRVFKDDIVRVQCCSDKSVMKRALCQLDFLFKDDGDKTEQRSGPEVKG